MDPVKGLDFELAGSELKDINRENPTGGGVAVYVDTNFSFKVAERTTTAVRNLSECFTAEIYMKNSKNVTVSCIYRAAGSDTATFKEQMEEMFTASNQKVSFICGDFNIDLLSNHKPPEDFINAMSSLSFCPKITRPIRITSHCATLIDNRLQTTRQ